MPQAVLGVAFSFGIPMAYIAVQHQLPAQAGWLWLGNLFWVLAYDTEYAMVDRDDDLKIGIQTSAITLGRFDVAAVLAFYTVFLLLWALAVPAQLAQPLWWWAGWAVAVAQVGWHMVWIRTRARDGCFRAFRLNHWIGFALFVGIGLASTP